MALLLIEGFEGLTDVSDVHNDQNTGGVAIETSDQRTGQGCLKIDSTAEKFRLHWGGTSNEIYICYAFNTSTFGARLLWTSGYITLTMTALGELVLKQLGTVLGTTDPDIITINTWHYIEVCIVKKNSLIEGDMSLRIDGVEVIAVAAGLDSLSSLDTPWTPGMTFEGRTGYIWMYDDMYVCDETGSICNTFLGDVKVAAIFPDGNGNQSDFVGSDADSTDNYLHVDENPDMDDDTSYVESDTAGDIDLYTFDDLPAEVGIVHGLQIRSMCSKDVPGHEKVVRSVCRSGGTNYTGDDRGAPLGYAPMEQLLEEDPDTSARWLKAGIDSAEFGIKLQSSK